MLRIKQVHPLRMASLESTTSSEIQCIEDKCRFQHWNKGVEKNKKSCDKIWLSVCEAQSGVIVEVIAHYSCQRLQRPLSHLGHHFCCPRSWCNARLPPRRHQTALGCYSTRTQNNYTEKGHFFSCGRLHVAPRAFWRLVIARREGKRDARAGEAAGRNKVQALIANKGK